MRILLVWTCISLMTTVALGTARRLDPPCCRESAIRGLAIEFRREWKNNGMVHSAQFTRLRLQSLADFECQGSK